MEQLRQHRIFYESTCYNTGRKTDVETKKMVTGHKGRRKYFGLGLASKGDKVVSEVDRSDKSIQRTPAAGLR